MTAVVKGSVNPNTSVKYSLHFMQFAFVSIIEIEEQNTPISMGRQVQIYYLAKIFPYF